MFQANTIFVVSMRHHFKTFVAVKKAPLIALCCVTTLPCYHFIDGDTTKISVQ